VFHLPSCFSGLGTRSDRAEKGIKGCVLMKKKMTWQKPKIDIKAEFTSKEDFNEAIEKMLQLGRDLLCPQNGLHAPMGKI